MNRACLSGYDRYLKRLRASLAGHVEGVRQAIAKYFPKGTRVSRPAGGYMLWVELPPKVESIKLFRAALAEHITILPGTIFSATGRYKNYIRINCGHAWSDTHDRALLTLGRLCEQLVQHVSNYTFQLNKNKVEQPKVLLVPTLRRVSLKNLAPIGT